MKVTFKTGSEVNYGSTNGELFFASNTKQIMLNGIKYIPKKLSELINDSGFISSITKSMVEGVLTGNITSHTHSYLPLSGGTMTGSIYINNTVPITHKTAESGNWIYISKLLTGSNVSDKKYEACIGWLNQGGDGVGGLTLIPYAQDDAPWTGRIGLYIAQNSLKFNNTAVSLDGHTHSYLPLSGGTLTGTLNMPGQQINAGSITVSDSISAGSISANSISCQNKDVSLVGHTHTFASLESKPTKLSGYGITDIKPARGYNYSNGCLVKTKVSNTGTFVRLHIYGTTNTSTLNKVFKPICTIVDCFNYSTGVIELNATHFGEDFGAISAFIYNGYLCFWFKQSRNYEAFNVYGYITNYESDIYNIVSKITNQSIPSENVSNLITVTPTKIAYAFGTSSQFLKGDGSLDSNTYALSSDLNNYLPLSGGTMTGTLNMPGQQINAWSITVSADINADSISANSITCDNKDVSLDGHTHTFASLESKPTKLSGYGITDAYTKTETNTELGKYLPLTGGTLNGALTVPKFTSTGGILLGNSSLSEMIGSIGIQRYDETGFIGFLKDFNLGNSFNGVVLGWDGNYSLQENSVRIDASTFTYKGNSVLHSGNLRYTSSGLSRAVQKDTNGNLYIVAPSLFEQGISNNYPKNLRWSNETDGQLVYEKEIEAGNFDTVEIGIPLANGTSKGFLKSTSTVANVTGYTPCPVVSGTPYYKLDDIELDYTDFLEIGSGNIESHLPITIKVQEGGSLKYLFDYTVDNIPRLLTISEGNFCKYFFWLQQTDDDTPIVAYYHCQFNDLWLVIDSPNMEVRISQGSFLI